MKQGINSDNLKKDIIKLEYQNNEINKNLKEFYFLKTSMEKEYTSPISQEEIDYDINNKINILCKNKEKDIDLLKSKIPKYANITEETETTIKKVEVNIKNSVKSNTVIK